MKKPHNFKDLTNKTFGKLTVIRLSKKRLSKYKSNHWECLCECGKKKIIVTQSLTSGRTKSCGCLRKQKAYNNKTIGNISGLAWSHIICSARSRQIKIEITQNEAWELFLKQNGKCALTGRELVFKKYIGKRNGKDIYSEGTASLDRIDSSQGYIKKNIQWVHKDVNWLKNKFDEKKLLQICKEIVSYAS